MAASSSAVAWATAGSAAAFDGCEVGLDFGAGGVGAEESPATAAPELSGGGVGAGFSDELVFDVLLVVPWFDPLYG
jgi:hypothetical protein